MGGGNHFPGTTSLDAATLIALVRDLLKEFARHGARRIVVLDGHCENMMFLIEAIDLALRELHRDGINDLRIVRLEYWDFTTEETLNTIFPNGFPGVELEHAAVLETSMGLHLFPHLVNEDRIPDDPVADFPPYDIYPTDTRPIPPSGVLSPAHGASRAHGELLIEEAVERISQALREAFDAESAV
jgi:creatinine amidohydrolase